MQNKVNYAELTDAIVQYSYERQSSFVAEIERILAESYRAQKASFWRYDKACDTLESLSEEKRRKSSNRTPTSATYRNTASST